MTREERIRAIIDRILVREGGAKFTNLAADRGGATKYGVTQLTLTDYRVRRLGLPPASVDDVRDMTEETARAVYRWKFIEVPRFDQVVDDHLCELLIDAGVNHDPRHPSKWVQWAAEVPQDGVLGPVSLKAINACAPLELFLWVCAYRFRLYGRLVSQDPQLKAARTAGFRLQADFSAGWNNRVADFLEDAARRIEADHRARTGGAS